MARGRGGGALQQAFLGQDEEEKEAKSDECDESQGKHEEEKCASAVGCGGRGRAARGAMGSWTPSASTEDVFKFLPYQVLANGAMELLLPEFML